jgi:hypothetical protein
MVGCSAGDPEFTDVALVAAFRFDPRGLDGWSRCVVGRAYSKELVTLASTYEWASKVAIDPLVQFDADAEPIPG